MAGAAMHWSGGVYSGPNAEGVYAAAAKAGVPYTETQADMMARIKAAAAAEKAERLAAQPAAPKTQEPPDLKRANAIMKRVESGERLFIEVGETVTLFTNTTQAKGRGLGFPDTSPAKGRVYVERLVGGGNGLGAYETSTWNTADLGRALSQVPSSVKVNVKPYKGQRDRRKSAS